MEVLIEYNMPAYAIVACCKYHFLAQGLVNDVLEEFRLLMFGILYYGNRGVGSSAVACGQDGDLGLSRIFAVY